MRTGGDSGELLAWIVPWQGQILFFAPLGTLEGDCAYCTIPRTLLILGRLNGEHGIASQPTRIPTVDLRLWLQVPALN